MRPEEGKNGASRAPARRSCLWSSCRIRGHVLPPKGGTMDAKDLLWLSSGFRTVDAWRDAMCAHGYRVPVHLCHGLHEAMQYLDLTFSAAFRLLWVNGKISVNERVLVYDFSVSDLWAAGKRPASTPAAGSLPPAVAWDRDVLALIPATEEILRLNSAWCLTADSSPLMKLALWRPDEDDEFWRQFLLDFGDEVAAAAWKRPDRQEGVREDQEYARVKELAFKDGETGLYNRRLFSRRSLSLPLGESRCLSGPGSHNPRRTNPSAMRPEPSLEDNDEMQSKGGQLLFSPSDLGNFTAC